MDTEKQCSLMASSECGCALEYMECLHHLDRITHQRSYPMLGVHSVSYWLQTFVGRGRTAVWVVDGERGFW